MRLHGAVGPRLNFVPLRHAALSTSPIAIELFRNKRQGKLSFKKAMEGAKRWVYSSETTVR
jgi:hypothetical protein